jgi:hypothetical protein
MLYDASNRFVLKFATYSGLINYDDVTGYTAAATLAATTAAIANSEL